MRGVGACSEEEHAQESPGALTAVHPPPHHQLPPVPLPSALSDPRELATVTVSLGAFPPLLETFIGKTLAGTMTLMGCVRAGRGESQGRQILGEN